MTDFDSLGARRQDDILANEIDPVKTQYEALESFIALNPVPNRIGSPVRLAKEYLFATEARCREQVDSWMQKLLADDLASEEDLEIISQALYRKVDDLQTQTDAFNHTVQDILNADLNAILRRHKGE
jgi:hypothetical protein